MRTTQSAGLPNAPVQTFFAGQIYLVDDVIASQFIAQGYADKLAAGTPTTPTTRVGKRVIDGLEFSRVGVDALRTNAMSINANVVTKQLVNGLPDTSWQSGAICQRGFRTGAAEFRIAYPQDKDGLSGYKALVMMALTDAFPTGSYTELKYAIYANRGNGVPFYPIGLVAYESGSAVGLGAAALNNPSHTVRIEADAANIRYFIDGVLYRTRARADSGTLYAAVSIRDSLTAGAE
jgi:hypothetical protein